MTTATAPLDVNERFQTGRTQFIADQRDAAARAETRAAQQLADAQAKVDAGQWRNLGNGRFEVLTGWDRGEIWTVRRNVGGQALVLPEHGLRELGDGKVALYSRVPMWHKAGFVVPQGLSSIDSVLEAAGLNYVVTKEQATRWTVRPGAPLDEVPGRFWTVREDTDTVVGHVGADYQVIQNADQFRFLQELVDMTSGSDVPVVWETAGELTNGRIFVCLRLGDDIIIDVDGYNDAVRPFLLAINSHDGSTKFSVTVTPWRVGCGNTERFAIRDAITSWSTPHTAGATRRMGEARKTLRMTSDYYRRYVEEEQMLARAAMSVDEFAAFAAEFNDQFWPLPELDEGEQHSVRATNGRQRRIDALVANFDQNAEAGLGRTPYAAERAVTQWLDWDAGIRTPKSVTEDVARATKALAGGNDTKKAHVHEKLMLRVR